MKIGKGLPLYNRAQDRPTCWDQRPAKNASRKVPLRDVIKSSSGSERATKGGAESRKLELGRAPGRAALALYYLIGRRPPEEARLR